MPFLLAEILNFQGSTHLNGVGSLSVLLTKDGQYFVEYIVEYFDVKVYF